MKQKFSAKKNEQLVINQHKIDKVFHVLRQRNGVKCYIKSRKRRERVVKHYLRRFHLVNTSVERFWFLFGVNTLTGKVN